jgi:hypothetical protein
VYSQAFVESEDEVQNADDDADKGSSDDEPDDSTLASVKKRPR